MSNYDDLDRLDKSVRRLMIRDELERVAIAAAFALVALLAYWAGC